MKKYVKAHSNYQSDIPEEVTKEEVYDSIYDALEEVGSYFAKKLGTTSGDVSPMDEYEYNELIEQLSECMLRILQGQLPYDEDDDIE